jgi:hypothetical protein
LPFLRNLLLYLVFKEEKVLKRYQVLLPDWLGDWIEHLVDMYDLSFSEIIRAEICYSILAGTANLYPDHKLGLTVQEISKLSKKNATEEMNRDEMLKTISKMYFETRKAVEFRLAKERKNIKKNKKKKK